MNPMYNGLEERRSENWCFCQGTKLIPTKYMAVLHIMTLNNINSRGAGYMDVVEVSLPYRNATKIFMSIFDFEKYFILQILINQRTYITHNENIASFAQYYAGLCTHPNLLATQLSRPSAFRRLKTRLPSDLPHRFAV
jgi:hypothetical protein